MTRGTTKFRVAFYVGVMAFIQPVSDFGSSVELVESGSLHVSRRHGLQLVGEGAHVERAGAGRCSRIPQT